MRLPCESSFDRYLRYVRAFWPCLEILLKCVLNAICGMCAASGHAENSSELHFERYLRYVRNFWSRVREHRNLQKHVKNDIEPSILIAICGMCAAFGIFAETFEMYFERHLRYVRRLWPLCRDLRIAF